jgi:ABC-type oligopeptide transport system substrate-binding subunit
MKKVIAILVAILSLCAISNSANAQATADKVFNIGKHTVKLDSLLVFKDAEIMVFAKLVNGVVKYSSKDAVTGDPMPINVAATTSTVRTIIVMEPIKCVSKCVAHDRNGKCTKYSTTCK